MFNNVAGNSCRKINRCRENVAGESGRRCDFVFECLLELLEDVLGEREERRCDDVAGDFGRKRCNDDVAGERGRRCDCEDVFECLEELLEEVLGENENHKCHRN